MRFPVVLFDLDGTVIEAEIRARLAEDPWAEGILIVASVEPWSVWLRSGRG
jgi:beta-phosphoglucomutase-like phosphatase (HAD superfamily)